MHLIIIKSKKKKYYRCITVFRMNVNIIIIIIQNKT